MLKKINFITSNINKVERARKILEPDFKIENINIDIEEPQSPDIDYISKFKVNKGYEICGEAVMAEDGGFFFDKYPGFPGAYSRDISNLLKTEGILKLVEEGDRGYWCSAISYKDKDHEFLVNYKIFGTFTKEICKIDRSRSMIGKIFKPDGCNGKYMVEVMRDSELYESAYKGYEEFKRKLLGLYTK